LLHNGDIQNISNTPYFGEDTLSLWNEQAACRRSNTIDSEIDYWDGSIRRILTDDDTIPYDPSVYDAELYGGLLMATIMRYIYGRMELPRNLQITI